MQQVTNITSILLSIYWLLQVVPAATCEWYSHTVWFSKLHKMHAFPID